MIASSILRNCAEIEGTIHELARGMRRLLLVSTLICAGCESEHAVADGGGGIGDSTGADSTGSDGGGTDGTNPDGTPYQLLPLGNVINATAIDCSMVTSGGQNPMPKPSNATQTCSRVTVTCPNIDPLDAFVAITSNQDAALIRGTIFAHNGGPGDQYLNPRGPVEGSIMQAAFDDNLAVVQVSWVLTSQPVHNSEGWELATVGGGNNPSSALGVKSGACRPATLMRYVYDTFHNDGGDKTAKPFCAIGKSGGSAAISYALAHYGAAQGSPNGYLDYAALLSGPPFGRIDVGCQDSTRITHPFLPPDGTPHYPVETKLGEPHMDFWTNLPANKCGSLDPANQADSTYISNLQNQSVVSSGALYNYPKTSLWFGNCVTTSAIGNGAGASYYVAEIRAQAGFGGVANVRLGLYQKASDVLPPGATLNDPPFINNGCVNESLMSGFDDVIEDIKANCKVQQ